ncbi:5-methyltetrahydropteroyltriglutamate--homocysteine S-methyltransferase [Agromyces mediolanus]|uniref:5-methyltetrahydropteroyltriglutamate-- homocysteine S-methyltransferase n=1 Tax=Agromyces mediolanus TaxID=41986 RepID=UPI002040F4CF|nr:5-methyltetrahydropteroyltriglutamate--homocysteine S-methyltransferase [Agromyces mediolanus]MCM3656809.1 5-methyltetrahydropteroyltriglutamate--homocysteine S-methyltransferase [Agromyces mediolanus]
MTAPAFPAGTILGYPRIGRRRELKRAVEAYWAGRIDAAELDRRTAELRSATRARLVELGLGRDDSAIPDSYAAYDQVLDTALAVGAVPERFAHLRGTDGSVDLDGEFVLARGEAGEPPLEMTKWFDTNYHYLVPELAQDSAFGAHPERLVARFTEALAEGVLTRPVLVGPVTLLALAKPAAEAPEGFRPLDELERVLPVYAELLARLAEAGAEWVQLDEPALASESLDEPPARLREAAERAYAALGAAVHRPALFVAAPYGGIGEALGVLAEAPIEAIGLDLVRGELPSGLDDGARRALAGKTLVAGVVDGRNIWRGDLAAAFERASALEGLAGSLAISTSTSLQHVPHDLADEERLDPRLASWLAFADQKVAQVATLARGLAEGREAIATELEDASAALVDRAGARGVRVPAVRDRLAALSDADFSRVAYGERVAAQSDLALPQLPTTTIGSFPQTGELRRARAELASGALDEAGYRTLIEQEIERVVRLQEELGLDVLVHGEPERNDMVQYFAELLDGFAVTEHGWVQSYGSRCTRPSILWGDVSRPAPMTVGWSAFAQSLTERHLKGMLTGPVTILAWSFVRDDQPLAETARQVGLALRDEVADLEAAGIRIIQVDEPALRELLPLRRAEQPAYLDWSVGAFRLATGGAAPSTQVHTHLCYSEFGVVIDAIRGLDADVTSIEAARSRMEVVEDLGRSGFDHGVGPGVYDIHSPRVPGEDEVRELLERAVAEVPAARLWVNPDCGLKTRGYEETVASLGHLVGAARAVREALARG